MAEVAEAASALGAVVGPGAALAPPVHRQCDLEIHNVCKDYSLCNPRMYLKCGYCVRPQSPFVDPGTTDVAVFAKNPHLLAGTVGVITYDLHDHDTKESSVRLAVLFSVPYDFVSFRNVYAAGIFDQSKACDKSLYQLMIHGSGPEFSRKKAQDHDHLIHKGECFTIMATMSDAYQPIIKLRITQA